MNQKNTAVRDSNLEVCGSILAHRRMSQTSSMPGYRKLS